MTKTDLVEQLEHIVDAHSLLDVLTALELMCLEKGEHLRCNWQDERTAKNWGRASKACYTAAQSVDKLAI